jgi:hypothetical protein
MFSVITNIYNKKPKGPTLMELFTATGKMKKCFFIRLDMFDMCTTGDTAHIDACVWQELEYRIDVCRVTRGAHIEHL